MVSAGVELARILFAGSDVLCLDEPTNHLDIDAKQWLLGFLRQYRGALSSLVTISNSSTRQSLALATLDRPNEGDTGHLIEYRGTYTQYVSARAEDERRQAKLAAQQEREIARMQSCRSFRSEGDKGRNGSQHGEANRPPRI